MQEFLQLNPWIESTAAIIAVLVFAAGIFALLALSLGVWLLRTAVRARKMLGMVATIAAVPGKSGKAKFALGLMLSNVLSHVGGRIRKSTAAKPPVK